MQLHSSLRTLDIKQSNKMNVLQYIRQHKESTKPEIAKQLGYSAPTVSKLVDELVEINYVKITGTGTSTDQGGKRPKLFAFNPMGGSIVALHVGVQTIEAGLLNLEGEVLFHRSEKIKSKDTSDKIVEAIEKHIEMLMEKSEQIGLRTLGIGIGCPGLVEFATGTILKSYKIHVLENVQLGTLIRQKFDCPIWIDNECNNLALAEKWFGDGGDHETAINLLTEAGIGAGIIIDHQLIRGADNSFGEVGHTVIDMHGPECDCGNHGCWELFASTEAVIKRLESTREQSDYLCKAGAHKEVQMELIAEAIQAGDDWASQIAIKELGEFLAIGIVNLVNIFNPNSINIHGEMKMLGQPLLEEVKIRVRQKALPAPAKRVRIDFSKLGDHAHVIGAGALCVKELFESPDELFRRSSNM
ncbi:ROK family transcriptional regulator [Paenibacillus sp. GCM10027628]|uniref:ROK family transcriptional regulator n=1 Tax=Paenibacillus sp. GCM10027628 TaxID=3273413 RepID=UPI00362BC831